MEKIENLVVREMKLQGMPMALTALALAKAETDNQFLEVMKYLMTIRDKEVDAKEAVKIIQNIVKNN